MDTDSFVKLVIGICGPAFAAWGVVKVAQIRAGNKTPTPATPPPSTPFAENIALNEYIDAKIEAATKPLREEIARMTAYVQRTARVLKLLREAFRQFIREVARDWGKTTQPPQIDPLIRDMLLDDDLDNTFGGHDIEDVRAEYNSPPRSEDYGS